MLFRNRNKKTEADKNPKAEQLAGHLSTDQIVQNETFAESDDRTDRVNVYHKIQKLNEPKTVAEEGAREYQIVKAYKKVAHSVSFITVMAFVYGFSCNMAGLNPISPFAEGDIVKYFFVAIGLTVFGAVALWIESTKRDSMNAVLLRNAQNKDPFKRHLRKYRFTVASSVILSLIGGIILSMSISDKSDELAENRQSSERSLQTKKEAAIAESKRMIDGNIADLRGSIKSEEEGIRVLETDKIRGEIRWGNSAKIEKARKRIRDYQNQIRDLSDSRMKVEQSVENQFSRPASKIQSKYESELAMNTDHVMIWSVVAILFILIVEGGGWIATMMIFRYRVAVEQEGVKYGIIHDKRLPTEAGILDVIRRRSQELLQDYNTIYVPASGKGYQPASGKDQKIGFQQGYSVEKDGEQAVKKRSDSDQNIDQMIAEKVEVVAGKILSDLHLKISARIDEAEPLKKAHPSSRMNHSKNFSSNQFDWFNSEDAEAGRKTQKRSSKVKAQRAKHLREQGLTIAQIATKMKCHQSTVKRYLKRS